jgi:hypothetical protein
MCGEKTCAVLRETWTWESERKLHFKERDNVAYIRADTVACSWAALVALGLLIVIGCVMIDWDTSLTLLAGGWSSGLVPCFEEGDTPGWIRTNGFLLRRQEPTE